MIAIYKITSPSGSVYIGQSWNIKKRFAKYYKAQCEGQRYLYNSFKKYGPLSHDFRILYEFSENEATQTELDKYEVLYWRLYKDRRIKMLNVSDAGKGGKMSEETKKLLSKVKLAKQFKHSDETKEKCRIASTGKNYSKGHKCPEWLKDKLRNKMLGVPRPDVSKRLLGRKKSESHRVAMFTAKQDKTIYNFINYKTNEEFVGIRDTFRKKYNLDGPSIGRVIKGDIKHHKNWSLIYNLHDILSKIHAKEALTA